jgi:hypothetical protein
MTSDYALTYDDGDTPRHYSFKGGFEVPRTLERYHGLSNGEGAASPAPPAAAETARALADQLAPEVAEVVAALDQRGRWLDDGKINSATFVANMDLLARYVAATNGEVLPRLALLDH